MKVYTIGRGEDCDIILDDETGMVSRRHAILKSKGFNRYEIVDVSTNGTKVDAMRIKPNTPIKVTRNSVVTFAEVKQLDWSKIPDDMKPVRIIAIALAALAVIIGGWIAYNALTEKKPLSNPEPEESVTKSETATDGGGSPTTGIATPPDSTTSERDVISAALQARENKDTKKAKGKDEDAKTDEPADTVKMTSPKTESGDTTSWMKGTI